MSSQAITRARHRRVEELRLIGGEPTESGGLLRERHLYSPARSPIFPPQSEVRTENSAGANSHRNRNSSAFLLLLPLFFPALNTWNTSCLANGWRTIREDTDFEAATTFPPPMVQIGVLSSLAEDFD